MATDRGAKIASSISRAPYLKGAGRGRYRGGPEKQLSLRSLCACRSAWPRHSERAHKGAGDWLPLRPLTTHSSPDNMLAPIILDRAKIGKLWGIKMEAASAMRGVSTSHLRGSSPARNSTVAHDSERLMNCAHREVNVLLCAWPHALKALTPSQRSPPAPRRGRRWGVSGVPQRHKQKPSFKGGRRTVGFVYRTVACYNERCISAPDMYRVSQHWSSTGEGYHREATEEPAGRRY